MFQGCRGVHEQSDGVAGHGPFKGFGYKGFAPMFRFASFSGEYQRPVGKPTIALTLGKSVHLQRV